MVCIGMKQVVRANVAKIVGAEHHPAPDFMFYTNVDLNRAKRPIIRGQKAWWHAESLRKQGSNKVGIWSTQTRSGKFLILVLEQCDIPCRRADCNRASTRRSTHPRSRRYGAAGRWHRERHSYAITGA